MIRLIEGSASLHAVAAVSFDVKALLLRCVTLDAHKALALTIDSTGHKELLPYNLCGADYDSLG